jgi:hypothetical protein
VIRIRSSPLGAARRLRNAVLDFTVVAVPSGFLSGGRDEADYIEHALIAIRVRLQLFSIQLHTLSHSLNIASNGS